MTLSKKDCWKSDLTDGLKFTAFFAAVLLISTATAGFTVVAIKQLYDHGIFQ